MTEYRKVLMSPQAKISSNPNFCYAQRNRTYDKTSWVYVSMYVFERSDPGLTPEIYQQMKCPLGVSNWNDRITFSSFASANCILSCPGRSGTWEVALPVPVQTRLHEVYSILVCILWKGSKCTLHIFALRKSWKNSTKHWSNCLW